MHEAEFMLCRAVGERSRWKARKDVEWNCGAGDSRTSGHIISRHIRGRRRKWGANDARNSEATAILKLLSYFSFPLSHTWRRRRLWATAKIFESSSEFPFQTINYIVSLPPRVFNKSWSCADLLSSSLVKWKINERRRVWRVIEKSKKSGEIEANVQVLIEFPMSIII